MTFLDVGQGDATLLQRDGVAILVDTGPPGGPILRRLDDAGVERLDLLVITHAQADHEGMALPVIAELRPRLVLDGGAGWPTAVQRALPAALARAHGRRVAARAGQTLRLGGLRLDVLWPPPPPDGWRPEGDPNGRAVVAHVRAGAFDLLLPADAESDVTAALDLPRVEALKVAHHGSDDPGLPAMLDRLAPRVAAVEVGEGNTYGHPTPATMRALGVVPRGGADRPGRERAAAGAGRADDGRARGLNGGMARNVGRRDATAGGSTFRSPGGQNVEFASVRAGARRWTRRPTRSPPVPGTSGHASRLAPGAQLPPRLPHPRRRPRPHRRAPPAPPRHGRAGERRRAASSCSRATPARPTP